MFHKLLIAACSLLATAALATDQPVATPDDTQGKQAPAKATAPANDGPKALSGMSILGNQEAPKALVIVPWKSSQLGDSLGISHNLDDGRQPVDKDVFLRQLSYYEIRSQSK